MNIYLYFFQFQRYINQIYSKNEKKNNLNIPTIIFKNNFIILKI